jgi:hypothetical protein
MPNFLQIATIAAIAERKTVEFRCQARRETSALAGRLRNGERSF